MFLKVVLLKNKKPITNFEECGYSINILSEKETHFLRIEVSEAERNLHDGMYQIVASNNAGEIMASVQVNIKGK